MIEKWFDGLVRATDFTDESDKQDYVKPLGVFLVAFLAGAVLFKIHAVVGVLIIATFFMCAFFAYTLPAHLKKKELAGLLGILASGLFIGVISREFSTLFFAFIFSTLFGLAVLSQFRDIKVWFHENTGFAFTEGPSLLFWGVGGSFILSFFLIVLFL
ncbi:MAG: hypothetical protein WD003_01250 [Candidatus Paceibacterota bacterium]